MPERVDAAHIASYGGFGIDDFRFEPQRKNNFTLRVTPPTVAGGEDMIGGESILALAVKELPFPQEESDVLEIAFGNEIRKVAGMTKFSNEQLTVRDYVSSVVADVIHNWRRAIFSPSSQDNVEGIPGRVGYAFEYKRDGELLFFGPDGNNARIWKLYGLWPRRVRYGTGSMTATAEANEIEVEFVIDNYDYLGLQP